MCRPPDFPATQNRKIIVLVPVAVAQAAAINDEE